MTNGVRLTKLLDTLSPQDPRNGTELLPLLCRELRRFAAVKLSREFPHQTLQSTALVHEAWLRLNASGHKKWRNRARFFSAAAEATRRLLVESARRTPRPARGPAWHRVEWDNADLPAMTGDERVLAINDALDELARFSPVQAEVAKLRFFAGLQHAEIATVLKLSERTVRRYWAFAKTWLLDWLKRQGPTAARDGAKGRK